MVVPIELDVLLSFFFNFGGFLGLVLGFGMKKHKVINFVTSFSNKDVSCTEVLAMPEQFF